MSTHPDAWLPQGYRGHVDQGQMSFIRNMTRVAVTRSLGNDGTEVWSGAMRSWVPLAPDEQLPNDDWTLDVPRHVARALYEALRAHYDETDLESVKSLTAARETAERRYDQLLNALIEISLSTARPRPAVFREDPMPLSRGQGAERVSFKGRPGGQISGEL